MNGARKRRNLDTENYRQNADARNAKPGAADSAPSNNRADDLKARRKKRCVENVTYEKAVEALKFSSTDVVELAAAFNVEAAKIAGQGAIAQVENENELIDKALLDRAYRALSKAEDPWPFLRSWRTLIIALNNSSAKSSHIARSQLLTESCVHEFFALPYFKSRAPVHQGPTSQAETPQSSASPRLSCDPMSQRSPESASSCSVTNSSPTSSSSPPATTSSAATSEVTRSPSSASLAAECPGDPPELSHKATCHMSPSVFWLGGVDSLERYWEGGDVSVFARDKGPLYWHLLTGRPLVWTVLKKLHNLTPGHWWQIFLLNPSLYPCWCSEPVFWPINPSSAVLASSFLEVLNFDSRHPKFFKAVQDFGVSRTPVKRDRLGALQAVHPTTRQPLPALKVKSAEEEDTAPQKTFYRDAEWTMAVTLSHDVVSLRRIIRQNIFQTDKSLVESYVLLAVLASIFEREAEYYLVDKLRFMATRLDLIHLEKWLNVGVALALQKLFLEGMKAFSKRTENERGESESDDDFDMNVRSVSPAPAASLVLDLEKRSRRSKAPKIGLENLDRRDLAPVGVIFQYCRLVRSCHVILKHSIFNPNVAYREGIKDTLNLLADKASQCKEVVDRVRAEVLQLFLLTSPVPEPLKAFTPQKIVQQNVSQAKTCLEMMPSMEIVRTALLTTTLMPSDADATMWAQWIIKDPRIRGPLMSLIMNNLSQDLCLFHKRNGPVPVLYYAMINSFLAVPDPQIPKRLLYTGIQLDESWAEQRQDLSRRIVKSAMKKIFETTEEGATWLHHIVWTLAASSKRSAGEQSEIPEEAWEQDSMIAPIPKKMRMRFIFCKADVSEVFHVKTSKLLRGVEKEVLPDEETSNEEESVDEEASTLIALRECLARLKTFDLKERRELVRYLTACSEAKATFPSDILDTLQNFLNETPMIEANLFVALPPQCVEQHVFKILTTICRDNRRDNSSPMDASTIQLDFSAVRTSVKLLCSFKGYETQPANEEDPLTVPEDTRPCCLDAASQAVRVQALLLILKFVYMLTPVSAKLPRLPPDRASDVLQSLSRDEGCQLPELREDKDTVKQRRKLLQSFVDAKALGFLVSNCHSLDCPAVEALRIFESLTLLEINRARYEHHERLAKRGLAPRHTKADDPPAATPPGAQSFHKRAPFPAAMAVWCYLGMLKLNVLPYIQALRGGEISEASAEQRTASSNRSHGDSERMSPVSSDEDEPPAANSRPATEFPLRLIVEIIAQGCNLIGQKSPLHRLARRLKLLLFEQRALTSSLEGVLWDLLFSTYRYRGPDLKERQNNVRAAVKVIEAGLSEKSIVSSCFYRFKGRLQELSEQSMFSSCYQMFE